MAASKRIALGLVRVIIGLLMGGLAVEIGVERHWFAALGQVATFDGRLQTQLLWGGLNLLPGSAIVAGNLWLAGSVALWAPAEPIVPPRPINCGPGKLGRLWRFTEA